MTLSPDRVRIAALPLQCRVGVSEEEREQAQELRVDVELFLGLHTAGKSDDLRSTVNYVEVCRVLRSVAEERPRRLIETVAEEAAAALLAAFDSVQRVRLHLKKPSALAAFGAAYAEVRIERAQADQRERARVSVCLGLGSNQGNRLAHFAHALKRLAEAGPVRAVSSLYETEPIGYQPQPDFWNAAVVMETDWPPRDLLGLIFEVERECGRQRRERHGPRTLDIDILLYGQLVCEEEGLVIPHPRMHERRFVLAPLAEIAPRAVHPPQARRVEELLKRLSGPERVKRLTLEGWPPERNTTA